MLMHKTQASLKAYAMKEACQDNTAVVVNVFNMPVMQ